jgi:dihydroorotate dehydrogenase electron transfer subunit
MEASARDLSAMASSQAHLLSNERLLGGCHRLAVAVRQPFPAPEPGQFCMLSLEDLRFPILPRPFSVLGCCEDDGLTIEFMVMPVGRGSGQLCSLREGDPVQLIGPLGKSFDSGLPDGPLVCVAGGYGVAPFLFLAETWERRGDKRLDSLTVVFGARTAERLTLADRLEQSGARVELCTDDGSSGWHGRVDGRLGELLASEPVVGVLTCGPEAMMEAVGGVTKTAGLPCFASLETVMGCGYAVCNGCAVAVDSADDAEGFTYELACREGTPFDESRLHWNLL